MPHDHSHSHDGPKQPTPFDPTRAAMLDDPAREGYSPTDAIVELAHVPPRGRVLDYGTGTGRYAIAIGRAHPDANVVAYDSQPEMLGLARARISEALVSNVSAAGPDSEALEPGSFDRIVAINVLHEIDRADFERMRSLLRKDGMILIIDWNAGVEREAGPPRDHVYTPREAIEKLDRNGLQAELVNEPRFPYHYVLIVRLPLVTV